MANNPFNVNIGTRSKTRLKWQHKQEGLPSQRHLKRQAVERDINNDVTNNPTVAVEDARYTTRLANFYATRFDDNGNPIIGDHVFNTEYFLDQLESYQGPETGIDEDVDEADFEGSGFIDDAIFLGIISQDVYEVLAGDIQRGGTTATRRHIRYFSLPPIPEPGYEARNVR